MKSPIIFTALRIGSKILFYVLTVYTLIFIITSLLRISGKNEKLNDKVFSYEMMSFSRSLKSASAASVETDDIRLYAAWDRYKVMVKPASQIGYYSFLSKLAFTCIGVLILWIFKRIFEQANLESPFRKSIYKLLITLSVVFLATDVLAFLDYLIVNQLISAELPATKLRLITETGRGAITAVIILAIATIYHKGIVLQEENELTV